MVEVILGFQRYILLLGVGMFHLRLSGKVFVGEKLDGVGITHGPG